MAFLEPLETPGQAAAFQFDESNVARLTEMAILAIVQQDIKKAEQEGLERNQSLRWAEDDRLYTFQVKQKNWEGTGTPRASLGVPVVLEHVNALHPQIMDILFEESPPFYPKPYPGTDSIMARAYTEVLEHLLDLGDAETEMGHQVFSLLFRGTGILKCYWQFKNGYKCPKFEFIERRHILVDPACRRPDIRKARWKAHRMYLTVRQLDALRSTPGYKNIPSLEELKLLAIPPQEKGPTNSLEGPSAGYGSMDISNEFGYKDRSKPTSIDPMNHPLEVIEYCNDDFVWTVLQQKILIREVSNKDDAAVLYLSGFFIEVEGEFDGIGIGSLLGNEQHLQQGVLNGFLDSLALSLMGMFKRKKGSSIFPQQIRVSPGRVVDVDNMDDLDVLEMPQPNQLAPMAIQESDARAARRSGANEVSVQGTFPETSGGVGRTAFGMNMLAQASSARMRKVVKVMESQVLIPALEWLVRTNPKHLEEGLVQEILSPELMEHYGLSYEAIMKAGSKLKFKMLAATKMKRRAAMLQAVPMLQEFFQQPTNQEAIKGQNKVFEFNEFSWMIMDAAGWPNKEQLIREMTEEEQMQAATENELMRELVMLREKTKIESAANIQAIDAKASGQAMNQVIKASLEDGVSKEQAVNEMQYMAGQQAANRELDAELEALNGESGNPGVGA